MPHASAMHSSVNGMKNESRALGPWGPGITLRGIKFSVHDWISGSKLKLTSIIGHEELLFFLPIAGLVVNIYSLLSCVPIHI